MATYPLPPYALFDTAAADTPAGAADVVLAKGVITLAGLSTGIVLKDFLSYVNTAYSAGVAEAWTAAIAGATVTAGVPQTLTVKRLDTNDTKQYIILPVTGDTTTTLATKIRTAINADIAPWIAATGSTTNVIMTEVGNVGGFIAYFSDAGVTQGTHTAHVNSSGSLAEVQQYVPAAAGTTYRKYDFLVRKLASETQSQATVWVQGHIVYWVQTGTNGTALNTALVADLNATVITAAADTIPYLAVI